LSYAAWQWNAEVNEKNYWIFQGNPNIFDFDTALTENLIEDWTVTAHKDKIKTGDKVIIWITGERAGCYALAEVISDPREKSKSPTDHLWKNQETNKLKAGIKITHNLIKNPIFQKEIASVQNLSSLKIGNQGTNFKSNKEEFETVLELAKKKSDKKYWLYSPGENGSKWEEFYDQGIMAIGWDELGDLNNLGNRENITEAIKTKYNPQNELSDIALANLEFRDVIKVGDVIIVNKGQREYLGYGIVTSDYFFDSNKTTFQKCRKVEWKKKGTWNETNPPIVGKTLTDITKYPDYVQKLIKLIGIQEIVMENTIKHSLNTIFYGPPGTGKTYHTVLRAAEIIENRIIDSYDQALAIYKAKLHDQIEFITFHQNYSYEDFVQGLRPDTDKDGQLSFEKRDGIFKIISDRALKNLNDSKKSSNQIYALNSFKNALENLKDQIIESETPLYINDTAYITAVEEDAFRYSADNWNSKDKDFNGFRMKFSDLEVFFEENITGRQQIKDLVNISGLAKQHATYFFKVFQKVKSMMQTDDNVSNFVEQKNYVLIIDEINRANISRVFGELITLIEPDKRSHGDFPIEARLPSGDLFIVPSNLYIIGTMNTADKSIALLDIALRRRFEFEAMYPQYEINGKEIFDAHILKKINNYVIETKGYDFQIGHAYFMGEHRDLLQRMNKRVIPLLMEYYMNDEKAVREILQLADLKIEENSWPIRITENND
jgi:5-methylcytosine-specific restriction protein B